MITATAVHTTRITARLKRGEHGVAQDGRFVGAQCRNGGSHTGYRPPRYVRVWPLDRRNPTAAFEHRESACLQHLFGSPGMAMSLRRRIEPVCCSGE